MRYKVVCKYLGTAYFGWQKQPNVSSVQKTIEDVLSTIFAQAITIYSSGRTDRGVHAKGQVFHFDAKTFPLAKLKYALNKMLPSDIEIVRIYRVNEAFHARFNAKSKVYEYHLYQKYKDPFALETTLFYPGAINIILLQEQIKYFIGRHNFQNFCTKESDEQGFMRDIFAANVVKKGKRYMFTFTGSGFMHSQVRMMIGALLAVNEGKESPMFIKEKLAQHPRSIISYKVSGAGLYLTKVNY